MSTRFRLANAMMLCGFVAGCGLSGTYPSLAPRPQELEQEAPPVPAPSTTPAAVDPAVATQIDRLLTDAQAGETAFRAELPRTERAVAAAGAAGSDSWAEAQQAVARLEASRSQTTVSAAELDALGRSRVETVPPTIEGDLLAINTASDQVRTLIEGQEKAIDRLTAALPNP